MKVDVSRLLFRSNRAYRSERWSSFAIARDVQL